MSDNIVKFLICTWGAPWTWKPACYIINDVRRDSKVTTAPLFNHVKPNVLIVIAADTLAPRVLSGSAPNNYAEIREKVTEYVTEYLLSEVPEVKESVAKGLVRLYTIIAPGAGKFNGSSNYVYTFTGPLTDFFSVTFYELSRIISEIISETLCNITQIELHLDLTHGVNYMPSLAYRAITKLASVLALAYNVKLTVYNAEPYPQLQQRVERPELRIHIVEHRKIKPEILTYWPEKRQPEDCLQSLPELPDKVKGSLCRDTRSILKTYRTLTLESGEEVSLNTLCRAFVSAIINGLPLVLMYTWAKLAQGDILYKMLSEVYNLWLKSISIEKNNNNIHVVRKLNFTDTFIAYVNTWITHKVLTRYMNKINIDLATYTDGVAFLTKLDSVRLLYGDLYKRLSHKLETVLSNDIEELENTIKQYIEKFGRDNKIISYADVIKGINKNVRIGALGSRNFIAHSGFPYQLVAVQLSSDIKNVKIGYFKQITDIDNRRITLKYILENFCAEFI